MNDDILSWEIFVLVYSNGSIAETAEKLSIDAPTVSKKLKGLEKRLGVTLFERNQRPFSPMPVASELVHYATELVRTKEKIASVLANRVYDEGQIIRLMVGNSQGKYLPNILKKFRAIHPQTRFNVISPVDLNEFKQRQADVSIVSGLASLPDYVFRSRGKMVFIPVASKKYVEENGKINSPQDLQNHITFGNLYPKRYSFTVNFVLKKKGMVLNVPHDSFIRWSSVEMAKEAVLQGMGIALSLPLFCCIDELEAGRLVPILNGWHRPSQQNYVAVHKDDWKKPLVRTFVEFFALELGAVEKSCELRLQKVIPKPYFEELLS